MASAQVLFNREGLFRVFAELRGPHFLASGKRQILETPHAAFPLVDGGIEHIVGVLNVRDLLTALLRGGTVDLRRIARPPARSKPSRFVIRAEAYRGGTPRAPC